MLEITLRFVPESLNEILAMHYRKRANYTKELKEAVYYECLAQKLNPITKFPVHVYITIHSKNKHKKDCDNYTAKAIIDGLVLAKVIPDDNTDYIKPLTVDIEYSGEDKTVIILK